MYSLNVFPLLEFPFISRDCFFWGGHGKWENATKKIFFCSSAEIRRIKKIKVPPKRRKKSLGPMH